MPEDLTVDERVQRLERRLIRERAARQEAERLLEVKSRELWEVNSALTSVVEQLAHSSAHDELTGLANRRALEPWIQAHSTRTPRTGSLIGVISIDLDRFKEVNDSLGHAAGDHLLRQIAARISDLVRGEDLVVREGGDEILVLLHGIHDCAGVLGVAQKVLESIRMPVDVEDSTIYPSASMGATVQFPGEETGLALRRADRAMYDAKAGGGDRVVCADVEGWVG
jgi:diguanylate cyclase (GGDEF)-like protein